MTTSYATEIPRSLIQEVFQSDQRTRGKPTLPAEQRERAQRWLTRILVDFDALDEHIGMLQSLYSADFCYPRARRDCWTTEQLEPSAEPTKFTQSDRLTDDRVSAVADDGINALDDDELARLILNPFALHDLFDVIDELHPDAWMPVIHDIGKALMQNQRLSPADSQYKLPSRSDNGDGSEAQAAQRAELREAINYAVQQALAKQLSPAKRYALPAATLLACAASLVAIAVGVRSIARNGALEDRLAANNQQTGANSGGDNDLIAMHAGHERIANWDEIWSRSYSPKLSPAENLKRLRAASGPEVNALIDQLKEKHRSDSEILAYLNFMFGPDHPELPSEK